MKALITKTVFILVLNITLISCHCKDEYKYVSEENKLIYNQGDMVVYKSDLGNIDTFRIEVKKFNDDVESGSCGFIITKTKTLYEEFIRYSFFDFATSVLKGYIEVDNKGIFCVFYYDSCGFGHDNAQFFETFYIDNKEYSNVYYVTSFKESCNFKEVYYNKPYGLLQYTFKTGEVWSLQR